MKRYIKYEFLRSVLPALTLFLFFAFTANAQETAPTPESVPDTAKECAEIQKQGSDYAAETFKIRLTISFKNNTSYWKGAAEELNFGIARRQVSRSLQSIAFKLGVKRIKDWIMVPLEEKLDYQKTVLRTLERERDNAMSANEPVLEARIVEIEKQAKALRLRSRDLGCADLPQEPEALPSKPEN